MTVYCVRPMYGMAVFVARKTCISNRGNQYYIHDKRYVQNTCILKPVIYMTPELHRIFVVFLAVRLVLDSDCLERKLLDGGTVYLLHCLMFLDCLIFPGLCMHIYLISS